MPFNLYLLENKSALLFFELNHIFYLFIIYMSGTNKDFLLLFNCQDCVWQWLTISVNAFVFEKKSYLHSTDINHKCI